MQCGAQAERTGPDHRDIGVHQAIVPDRGSGRAAAQLGSRAAAAGTEDCRSRARDLPATATAGQRDRLTGIALMTASAAANQLGAATAALAFPVLGPAGVVAVRQWVAGAVLVTTVRPRFTSFTRAQWRPVVALALIFATMNLSL